MLAEDTDGEPDAERAEEHPEWILEDETFGAESLGRHLEVLDGVAQRDECECDFMREVAAELPLQAIASLLGEPRPATSS